MVPQLVYALKGGSLNPCSYHLHTAERASDLWRRDLGGVDAKNCGELAGTETIDNTAEDEHWELKYIGLFSMLRRLRKGEAF